MVGLLHVILMKNHLCTLLKLSPDSRNKFLLLADKMIQPLKI